MTSVDDLKAVVKDNSTNLKTIIRHEIKYQRTTHQRDAEMRKELYRVNGLQLSDMIENLKILLCKEIDVSVAIVFPCEDEIFEILTRIGKDIPANSPDYIGSLHLK